MNEQSKRKADLEHLLIEARKVREILEHEIGRPLTDDELLALAQGEQLKAREDEGGLDYDELGDTCPRSSSD
jgi:hypothetical protein